VGALKLSSSYACVQTLLQNIIKGALDAESHLRLCADIAPKPSQVCVQGRPEPDMYTVCMVFSTFLAETTE